VPLLIPSIPSKGLNSILFFGVFPVVAFFLLVGGVFGLPHVETRVWGSLLVTVVISFTGIIFSLRWAFCSRSAGVLNFPSSARFASLSSSSGAGSR
jgi:hypothetical protein